jgi:hypothetical protein
VRTAKITTLLAASLAVIALPILAHHPFETEYDATKAVTLSGKIEDFNWDNPHCYIELDVTSGGNQGRWKLEGASRTTLAQNGWKDDTIGKGDMITVMAYRAKDGSMKGSGRIVTLADGKMMVFADAKEDGGPDPSTTTGKSETSKEAEVSVAQREPETPRPVTDPGEAPAPQAAREPEPAREPVPAQAAPRESAPPAAAQADRQPSDIQDELPSTAGNFYSIALAGLTALSGAYYLRRRNSR